MYEVVKECISLAIGLWSAYIVGLENDFWCQKSFFWAVGTTNDGAVKHYHRLCVFWVSNNQLLYILVGIIVIRSFCLSRKDFQEAQH